MTNRPRFLADARSTAQVILAALIAGTFPGRALAQEAAIEPSSTIELGVGGVTDDSFKAGEYNGLQDKGAFGVANISLRDRTPYDSSSAFRWTVKAFDLGLASRSGSASLGVQGRYRLTLGFDEIRRNRSDSYQTPYDGTGGTMLTLPSNWLVPTVGSPTGNTVSARGLVPSIGDSPFLGTGASTGAVIAPTAAQTATVDAAAAADLPAFHIVNLFTTRTRYNIGAAVNLNDAWSASASFRPEHKDGLKPMGTVSRNTGGDISTVIPDKIDNNHNQLDSNVTFTGKWASAQVGYYGSFFTNHVTSMSWQNWATPAHTLNTMSSAPSNAFQQVNGMAMFKMGSSTKLVANGSYGRATQNDAFLTDSTTPVVPVTSLNGLVVSTLFNAKLTSHPNRKWNLAAGYKYDDRDNRTPVNIYQYADAGDAPAANANFPAGPNNPLGAVLAQNANANRPYGRRLNLATASAEYALPGRQWITGAYEFEKTRRFCTGTWIDCADADVTNEHTERVDWRTVAGDVTVRAGYAHSQRRTPDYNENAFLALVPYANVAPASATGGVTALAFMTANDWTGYGPSLGFSATTGNMNLFFPSNNALANGLYANNNRISELLGFRRYWVADRDRDKLRSSLIWQIGDTFAIEGGLDASRDDYLNTTYGLQKSGNWAGNGDFTYTPTDNFTATIYYTYENLTSSSAGNTYTANSSAATVANSQPGVVGLSGNSCDPYTTLQQRNNNNKLDPCLNWTSTTGDVAKTVGGSLRRKMSKVDTTADLWFTRSVSDNNMTGGNWANNPRNGLGAPPTSIAAFYIPATPYPAATMDSLQLRISGVVPLKKMQSLRITYAYLYMASADWVYEGMQIGPGTITGVLPTQEQPFNYKVNVVSASYLMKF